MSTALRENCAPILAFYDPSHVCLFSGLLDSELYTAEVRPASGGSGAKWKRRAGRGGTKVAKFESRRLLPLPLEVVREYVHA
jgi:hypothetical protein